MEAYFQETPELVSASVLGWCAPGRALFCHSQKETLLAQLGGVQQLLFYFLPCWKCWLCLPNQGPGKRLCLHRIMVVSWKLTDDRLIARDALSTVLLSTTSSKENTLANVLSTNIKTDNYKAKEVRHLYPSPARAATLFLYVRASMMTPC